MRLVTAGEGGGLVSGAPVVTSSREVEWSIPTELRLVRLGYLKNKMVSIDYFSNSLRRFDIYATDKNNA